MAGVGTGVCAQIFEIKSRLTITKPTQNVALFIFRFSKINFSGPFPRRERFPDNENSRARRFFRSGEKTEKTFKKQRCKRRSILFSFSGFSSEIAAQD
jgi:hypothetical protein